MDGFCGHWKHPLEPVHGTPIASPRFLPFVRLRSLVTFSLFLHVPRSYPGSFLPCFRGMSRVFKMPTIEAKNVSPLTSENFFTCHSLFVRTVFEVFNRPFAIVICVRAGPIHAFLGICPMTHLRFMPFQPSPGFHGSGGPDSPLFSSFFFVTLHKKASTLSGPPTLFPGNSLFFKTGGLCCGFTSFRYLLGGSLSFVLNIPRQYACQPMVLLPPVGWGLSRSPVIRIPLLTNTHPRHSLSSSTRHSYTDFSTKTRNCFR